MDRGEVYKVTLDPTVGMEERGKRYVLIVTPERLNKAAGTAFVVPITNGGAHFTNGGLTVSLAGAGTIVGGVILCSQLRAIDLSSRQAERIERVPESIVDEVLAKLRAFLA